MLLKVRRCALLQCSVSALSRLFLFPQSTGGEGEDEECLKNTINIVNAALRGAEDCEQFQSKNARQMLSQKLPWSALCSRC